MEGRSSSTLWSPATKVVLKVVVYYAVLITVGWYLLNRLSVTSSLPAIGFDSMLNSGTAVSGKKALAAGPILDEPQRTIAVAAAMTAAILLSLPVAWIYQLTRAKRGYQQSVVQLMIILPLVVAAVVILVKNSVALAFSLGGIVAAVRFRNSLDDSKDAVYVFLATGVGLASAVDIPVATVISVIFNLTVLLLWYYDFGNSPIELEGSIANKRLKRARELARTGTFVAQIDNEVLKNMTRDQLEGLAQRALKRAHNDSSKGDGNNTTETILRVRTRNAPQTQRGLDLVLGEFARDWRTGSISIDESGVSTIDYHVRPKKAIQGDELLTLARTAGGADLIDAEIR